MIADICTSGRTSGSCLSSPVLFAVPLHCLGTLSGHRQLPSIGIFNDSSQALPLCLIPPQRLVGLVDLSCYQRLHCFCSCWLELCSVGLLCMRLSSPFSFPPLHAWQGFMSQPQPQTVFTSQPAALLHCTGPAWTQ